MNLNEWRKTHPSLFISTPPPSSSKENENMYIKLIDLVAETSTQSKMLQIPSDAPSGIYQLNIPGIYNLDPYTIKLFGQGKQAIADPVLDILFRTNPVQTLLNDGSTADGGDSKMVRASVWSYDSTDESMWVRLPGGVEVGHVVAFVKHSQGTPTDTLRFEGANEGWSQDQIITSILVHQTA